MQNVQEEREAKCWGCLEDQPNQLAHMDVDGCLYSEPEKFLIDTKITDYFKNSNKKAKLINGDIGNYFPKKELDSFNVAKNCQSKKKKVYFDSEITYYFE